MAYLTQGQNDCAVVSIANYTGKTYDEVIEAARFANVSPDTIKYRGLTHNEITIILFKLTGKVWRECKPRRGQDKLNGLISWHHATLTKGHMTSCIDGHVMDTDGSISPIESYRQRHNFHMRKCWTI